MRSRRGSLLCLIDRRRNPILKLLRQEGYFVAEAFTTDRAVALAAANHFDAAILDLEMFVETDGWSVAQSLKLVKPNLCVLLKSHAVRLNKRTPPGVDAMIPAEDDPQELLRSLRKLLSR